jgi:hypothetical protein
VPSIDDLFSQLPIGQIAARLGVDEATAEQAVRQALPALVGGLQANAADPGGADSLQTALAQHAPADPSAPVDLDQVDTADGEKIVGHVFGAQSDGVAAHLGAPAGLSSGMMQKLLPLLAPVVMKYLSGMFTGHAGAAAPSGPAAGAASSGGGLQDILGGLLGGGGGSGLQDILGGLGGLLGGGRKA